MFFLFSYYKVDNAESQLTLDPGYYDFEVVGATGGSGCSGKEGHIPMGGNPAKIAGRFRLKRTTTLNLVAGTKPSTTCDAEFNKKVPQKAGYGEGGNSGDQSAGAGGGYSSISFDWELIAMAGGGGGGATRREGTPAGGYDIERSQSYKYEYFKNDKCDKTGWKKIYCTGPVEHKGKDAKTEPQPEFLSGAGGGGGYYGGDAGTLYTSAFSSYKCVQPGVGGSSYVNTYHLLRYQVLDGIENYHNGHGAVTIYNLTACGNNCADCVIGNKDKCTECLPRYWLFEYTCYESCSQTYTPTYKDTTLNKCMRCIDRCARCSSGSTCEECISGYRFNGYRCAKIPPPTRTPTPTPSPSRSPTKTPVLPTRTPPPTKTPIPPTRTPLPSKTPISSTYQESEVYINETANTGSAIQASNNVNQYGNDSQLGQFGNKSTKESSKFPWWVIAVIAAGVALIVVIIAVVVCRAMKKEESSIEMRDEEAVTNTTNTSVTNEYPFYTTNSEIDEDPFKNDFDSDAPKSIVFAQKDIEEINEDTIVDPNYDF